MAPRTAELIAKKRDGQRLTPGEIEQVIAGYTDGSVPDYQMAALAMAIVWRGMDAQETAALLQAMLRSGDEVHWDDLGMPTADKHSTGGVGDKISIPLAPAVAACGVAVPMISGRGLGHTGGTLDKLEAIPGAPGSGVDCFQTRLSLEQFQELTKALGCCLIGQTERICPADKKLYSLRDVTATVESIPLIVASILSKKLAEGVGSLVLDVKVGSGAFMKTREETVRLGGEMLRLAGKVATLQEGEARIAEVLDNGKALERFGQIVAAQGGDPRVCQDPWGVLPRAPIVEPLLATAAGTVLSLDALEVGLAAVRLGAGRNRAEDKVDPAVGFALRKKPGDAVQVGDVLAEIHARTPAQVE